MTFPVPPRTGADAGKAAEPLPAGSVTTTYLVDGMVCHHCANHVTKAITGLGGVHRVDVDVQAGRVSVSSERELDEARLTEALDDIGYELTGRA
ncbi:heavy-metal-associated domain-containing protein [Streptomyces sp. NPDC058794]|uniref:heavy-metal-associated domain-containing protein n=1 Tax=unclassified Streptomyces TaxID=2593676 RepID=UPI00369EF614